MCYSPSIIDRPSGAKLEIACGKCARCRKLHVDDYVGRCLAQTSISRAVCCVTLSYRPDFGSEVRQDIADKVITPHHFQMFIKRLRNDGHKLKYLVAGEYGELKGRAHFHALLFFENTQPDWPAGQCHVDEWEHGHVFLDWNVDHRAVRYVCKYLQKTEPGARWFSMSKKPPLGAGWFTAKAIGHAEQGIFPRSFEYMPPGGSKTHKYLMTGATRRDFIETVCRYWRGPVDRSRVNKWVREALEKHDIAVQKVRNNQWAKDNPGEAWAAVKEELDKRRPVVPEIQDLTKAANREMNRIRLLQWIADNPDDPAVKEVEKWHGKPAHEVFRREMQMIRRG